MCGNPTPPNGDAMRDMLVEIERMREALRFYAAGKQDDGARAWAALGGR